MLAINPVYQMDKIHRWGVQNQHLRQNLNIDKLLKDLWVAEWPNLKDFQHSDIVALSKKSTHKQAFAKANLENPLFLSNFNVLIDGIYSLFKAIVLQKKAVSVIFVDPQILVSALIPPPMPFPVSFVPNLPLPDQFVRLPLSSFSQDAFLRRQEMESYYPDFLPSADQRHDHYEVRLERPSSPYASYTFDEDIKDGLSWWQKGTRIRDIPAQYTLFEEGILALEEQWIPFSWSQTFKKIGHIPEEAVVLHLDDHQDMMAPRIGRRLDDKLVDYVSGETIDFLNPESVKNSIISGAIGKGSIVTSLAWAIPKIHIRHLSFRAHVQTFSHLEKHTFADQVMFPHGNRIGLKFHPAHEAHLKERSNYVVTNDLDLWLKDLPPNVPILLHFDMDYFNNLFDGDSEWETNRMVTAHNPNIDQQKKQLAKIFQSIQKKELASRILNISIGISPGFYPVKFWDPMVNLIFKNLENLKLISQATRGIMMSKIGGTSHELTFSMQLRKRKQPSPQSRIESAATKVIQSVSSSASSSSKTRERLTSTQAKNITKSKSDKKEITLASHRPLKKTRSITDKSERKERDASVSKKKTELSKVEASQVKVEKMASKEFEGWKIKVDGTSCGFVKFIPKVNEIFKQHASVDFAIPAPKRGLHIGRFALKKAIQASQYKIFVAHLRKSNIASKKSLEAAGFLETHYPKMKQLCMIFRKSS